MYLMHSLIANCSHDRLIPEHALVQFLSKAFRQRRSVTCRLPACTKCVKLTIVPVGSSTASTSPCTSRSASTIARRPVLVCHHCWRNTSRSPVLPMQLTLMQIAFLLFLLVTLCCGVLERVPCEDLVFKSLRSATRLHVDGSAAVRCKCVVFVAHCSSIVVEPSCTKIGELSRGSEVDLLFGGRHPVAWKLTSVLREVSRTIG